MSQPREKKKVGTPLTYTPELGAEICNAIATSSKGIRKLCAEHSNWPGQKTIFEWRLKVKEFGEQYDKAKREQIEAMIDDCIDIADDSGFDAKINEQGNVVCDSEAINRARLRIDIRKWVASKLAPKIYGDKAVKDDDKDKHETSINELE